MNDLRAETRRILAAYLQRHVGPEHSEGRLTDREREWLADLSRRQSRTHEEVVKSDRLWRAKKRGDLARDCYLALEAIEGDDARTARTLLARAFDAPVFDPALFAAAIEACVKVTAIKMEIA